MIGMTFLLVTNCRDLTTDYVVREMKRRGHDFLRLNTEHITTSLVSIEPQQRSIEIRLADRLLNLRDVSAAYFRRPEAPLRPSEEIDERSWVHAAGEWSALLKSIYLFLGERWLSHPSSILLAEDKPRQLMTAVTLGLKIPTGLVTNAFEEVKALAENARIIGKPLKSALVSDQAEGSVVFTSLIPTLDEKDAAAIAACPAIYQVEIQKAFDVRVTVVGKLAFAVAIYSQDADESKVDWRRGSNPTLVHQPISLPAEIEAKCLELVGSLGLRFGAIDLICDKQGEYWFLECNPNGQWAWIENRTGYPISAAIVDELERIAAS